MLPQNLAEIAEGSYVGSVREVCKLRLPLRVLECAYTLTPNKGPSPVSAVPTTV